MILSVIATVIADLVLRTVSFSQYSLTVNRLALGLLFGRNRQRSTRTVGAKIVGTFGSFVGIIVLIFPTIGGMLAVFTGVALIFPNLAHYPENAAALITLSLMIFGLEPIISDLKGDGSNLLVQG